MNTKRTSTIALALMGAAIAVAALTGCTQASLQNDRSATDAQLLKYQQAQPVPQFDYSVWRQTLINIETAKVNGVATTTFFYNAGVVAPIRSCPSIGYSIPATTQLTNPVQVVSGGGGAVVGQMEPNGSYTGESTATFVVCVLPNGSTSVDSWEGTVYTVGGPAYWDVTTQQIVPDGEPTVSSDKTGQ